MDLSENDLSENDLSENGPDEETDEEAEDPEVSVEDCLEALPRAFLESLDIGELILFLPAIAWWLVALAGRALLHLLMPVARLLSTDYVSLFLSRGLLLFLFVLPIGFLFATLHDSAENDGPRSLFSYASEPRSNAPPPESRI
jgi:hypothetical protein